MNRYDERTLRMMDEYCSLHDQALMPKDIAEKFGVTTMTVYNRLGEIAEKNGVPRESLLEKPRTSPETVNRRSFKQLPTVDMDQIQQDLKSAFEAVVALNTAVTECLEQQEAISQTIQEEEESWERI